MRGGHRLTWLLAACLGGLTGGCGGGGGGSGTTSSVRDSSLPLDSLEAGIASVAFDAGDPSVAQEALRRYLAIDGSSSPGSTGARHRAAELAGVIVSKRGEPAGDELEARILTALGAEPANLPTRLLGEVCQAACERGLADVENSSFRDWWFGRSGAASSLATGGTGLRADIRSIVPDEAVADQLCDAILSSDRSAMRAASLKAVGVSQHQLDLMISFYDEDPNESTESDVQAAIEKLRKLADLVEELVEFFGSDGFQEFARDLAEVASDVGDAILDAVDDVGDLFSDAGDAILGFFGGGGGGGFDWGELDIEAALLSDTAEQVRMTKSLIDRLSGQVSELSLQQARLLDSVSRFRSEFLSFAASTSKALGAIADEIHAGRNDLRTFRDEVRSDLENQAALLVALADEIGFAAEAAWQAGIETELAHVLAEISSASVGDPSDARVHLAAAAELIDALAGSWVTLTEPYYANAAEDFVRIVTSEPSPRGRHAWHSTLGALAPAYDVLGLAPTPGSTAPVNPSWTYTVVSRWLDVATARTDAFPTAGDRAAVAGSLDLVIDSIESTQQAVARLLADDALPRFVVDRAESVVQGWHDTLADRLHDATHSPRLAATPLLREYVGDLALGQTWQDPIEPGIALRIVVPPGCTWAPDTNLALHPLVEWHRTGERLLPAAGEVIDPLRILLALGLVEFRADTVGANLESGELWYDFSGGSAYLDLSQEPYASRNGALVLGKHNTTTIERELAGEHLLCTLDFSGGKKVVFTDLVDELEIVASAALSDLIDYAPSLLSDGPAQSAAAADLFGAMKMVDWATQELAGVAMADADIVAARAAIRSRISLFASKLASVGFGADDPALVPAFRQVVADALAGYARARMAEGGDLAIAGLLDDLLADAEATAGLLDSTLGVLLPRALSPDASQLEARLAAFLDS